MVSIRASTAAPARLAVVLIVLVGLSAPALAAPEDDLAEAQRRANQAAAELSAAEDEMALAQDAVTGLQARVEAIEARVEGTRKQVAALAVRMYMGGTVPVIRVLRMANANEVIRAQQYSHVIAGGSTDALQQYRADREDLGREITALEEQQEVHAASVEALSERETEAIQEIDRLARVVAEARAARDAELAAEAAAAANRSAAAAAPANNTPTAGASPERPAATFGGSPAPAPAPTTTPPPAATEPPVDAGGGEWICPVQGPLAFSNDYGAPRGGGFSHQGNDILAPLGTPVVASVAGNVRHRSGAVSGLAYYLDGDDGNEYFGAHLDSYGASGRVSAGTVVGTVGNTGDASGGAPHLHFEIHPGGSGYSNPYSMLSRYC